MKYLLYSLFFLFLIIGCTNSSSKTEPKPAVTPQTYAPAYKSIQYIDSFISSHASFISKNTAARQTYEALCTEKMNELIKKGLYSDIPFTLITTVVHNKTAYGNFVYHDDKHFIKVQCIISNFHLDSLSENSRYFIQFKTRELQSGALFINDFSKIELPTPNAVLTSFQPAN